MRRPAVWLLATLALAACHRPDDSDKLSHKDAEAKAAIDKAVAANSTAASLRGLPVPHVRARALAYEVPTSFVGRWGITKADCDRDNLVTKGLLTISPDKLSFWQSKGSVEAIVRHSPYDITLKLAMTSEGREWASVTRLTLDAATTELVRRDASSPQSYRYNRC